MRRIFILLAVFLLNGCGVWSSTIRSDVLDYSNAIEETMDKFLLINVLEARDNAPIHFMEMPKINGSLQATASLSASVPFFPHPVHGGDSVINDSISPTVSAQSTPNFEVDNLDTKDFATGVSSPIDPKQIQYWFDRGLDHRLLLFLFFSSIQITYHECVAPDGKMPTAALKKKDRAEYKKQMAFSSEWRSFNACVDAFGTPEKECAPLPVGDNAPDDQKAYGDCLSYYRTQFTDAKQKCTNAMKGLVGDEAREAYIKCINVGREIEVRNSPRAAAMKLENCRRSDGNKKPLSECHAITSFEDYLKLVNLISEGFLRPLLWRTFAAGQRCSDRAKGHIAIRSGEIRTRIRLRQEGRASLQRLFRIRGQESRALFCRPASDEIRSNGQRGGMLELHNHRPNRFECIVHENGARPLRQSLDPGLHGTQSACAGD